MQNHEARTDRPLAHVESVVWFHVEPVSDELIRKFLRWQGDAQIYPVGLGGRLGGGRLSQGFVVAAAPKVAAWLRAHGIDVRVES